MLPLSDSDPLAFASYRLLGVLGSGGMGRVYLGESRSGRRVAIKVVRSDLAADPGWRRRFAREVSAARSVNPLFTAAVVDADTEAPEPWLATTYIDGPSLSVLVNTSGPLAPMAVLVLAFGLAEALAAIHRAGLVHRDLKPSNVIVNDDGPHIIDFGIALTAETPATTSLLLGTPSYIAPERIHGSEADPASDIFSLGATLVFAATGRPLVTEGPVYAQLMQITTGRFNLTAVPTDLRPLIVRCVSHQPQDRPTAEELSRILGAARVPAPASGWYTAADPVTAVPVVPPPRRLTRRRLLVAGGVIGAAAAAGVTVLLPPPPPVPRAAQLPLPVTTEPRPPPPPPVAGEILWQAASGAEPVSPSPGTISQGSRILVDGERIIAANGPDLFAISPAGRSLWRITLPAGLVTLRRWGEGVLVSDARRLWLFDLGGAQRFVAEVVAEEEAVAPADGADVMQIGGIALSPDLLFASLGTATIAMNRAGTQVWRSPRPPSPGVQVRPPVGGPCAANATWVLTHNVEGERGQAALRAAGSGDYQWNIQFFVPANAGNSPPPPPPGGGGRPENDEDFGRNEGRIGEDLVVLREARHLHAHAVSDGRTIWERNAPTPVVGIEIVGSQLLVAADRLTAVSLPSGAERWQYPMRGARLAATLDGQLAIVAGEGMVVALGADGSERWHTVIPPEFADAIVDEVTVDAHTAYVTFSARGQRREPLEADVLAIAMDPQAPRLTS